MIANPWAPVTRQWLWHVMASFEEVYGVVPLYVLITRCQHKNKIYEAHLLRRSYRGDGKAMSIPLSRRSLFPLSTW
jgi:hypothetical protein